MHNRTDVDYSLLIEDMKEDLRESIDIACQAGVPMENIILDPGIGLAKTMEDNFTVMRKLEEFTELRHPVLLGSSRKSIISHILDISQGERENRRGANTCLGITTGVQIFRVHQVKVHKELASMIEAIVQGVGVHGYDYLALHPILWFSRVITGGKEVGTTF